MTQALHLILCGFTGRMGQTIAGLAAKDSHTKVVGASTHPSAPEVGQDTGTFLGNAPSGIRIEASLEQAAKHASLTPKPVIIDFTSPEASLAHVKVAADLGLPMLIGTTGLSAQQKAEIQKAAQKIPLLIAANTSLGANLLYVLAHLSAKILHDADAEVSEVHHKHKKDAPGGTALYLAGAVAKARGQILSEHLNIDRPNSGVRKPGEIGVAAMRGGNVKGDHAVHFFGENETVELKHHISDRAVFAEGALKAAWYLAKQKPGLYTMLDVLDITLV